MDIASYRAKYGLSQSAFAALFEKATQALISQWERGDVRYTPERALEIERVTKGEVSRWELRPDLWAAPDVESVQAPSSEAA